MGDGSVRPASAEASPPAWASICCSSGGFHSKKKAAGLWGRWRTEELMMKYASLSSLNDMFSGWKTAKARVIQVFSQFLFSFFKSYLDFGNSSDPNRELFETQASRPSCQKSQRLDPIIVFENSLSALSKSHLDGFQAWGPTTAPEDGCETEIRTKSLFFKLHMKHCHVESFPD